MRRPGAFSCHRINVPFWQITGSRAREPVNNELADKKMRLKTIMTSLLCLATSAFASNWATYKSPAGFYQVQYPPNWVIQTEGNITNVVTPDGEGAITISAYHSGSGGFKDLLEIAHRRFYKAEAISPFEPLKNDKGKGIKGEFRTKEIDGDRRWFARAVYSKHVFVFITANDSDSNFQRQRNIYSKVLDSLVIHAPK